ncbi:mitochondria-eating protein isoform X1 [Balaenoptera musculus]|uniref:Mitochondria-eating protein n=1 Tax=Balaenoptera musculus TaxID=9771 RepID=A0A8B8XEN8_BALMU|nr:mitochondria-eating protein isoform X1 [Balaenoptera musculus]
MADNLRKLVSNESLRSMQDQLESWLREYNTNSCDQNLNHCLELIEQVAEVQRQLFGIFTMAAQEGGHYDGVETIKSRLLPWLEASFTAASLGKPVDSKVSSLQDTFDKDGHKESGARDRDIQQLDADLNATRHQLNQVQDDMAETEKTLEETKNRSAISLLTAEEEINQLRKQSARSRSPSPDPRSHGRSRSRSTSPNTAVAKVRSPSPSRAKLSSAARKAALLSRFSDAYSQTRLDAQCLLRRCIDKAETVQRIIYIAAVEAFHVAKVAFRHFKIRVRKSLTPSYAGSNDFEDAVLDYIICHLDLYDSQSSVNDVIRAMNVNPKISFPPEVDFCLLSNFIHEICCIAFAMQTLDPPLDIAFGADGEIFNDCKYRRSYDSDFTAPLVFYHVWPAIMENDCIIMKGEAVTRRGAFWNSVRSLSRCRSRSLSPICPRSRISLSTISRSRSPSPIRYGLPRF